MDIGDIVYCMHNLVTAYDYYYSHTRKTLNKLIYEQ